MSEELAQILLEENLQLKYQIVEAKKKVEEIRERYREYRHYVNVESNKQRKMDLVRERDIYKERIDKAIEYINKTPLQKGTEAYRIDLLNILQGSDKE